MQFIYGIYCWYLVKHIILNGLCTLATSCGSLNKCTPNQTLQMAKWPKYCKDFWKGKNICCGSMEMTSSKSERGSSASKQSTNRNCIYQELTFIKFFLDDMSNLLATRLCHDYWPTGVCCNVPSSNKNTALTLANPSLIESSVNAFTGIREAPPKTKYPPGIVTRFKCNEYSKWMSTDPGRQNAPKVAGKCRKDFFYNGIYGGEEADPLEFPHIAHLGYLDKYDDLTWSCGGSLISENFVLTAAHCQFLRYGTTHSVRLGSFGRVEIIPVIEVIVHPGYDTKDKNHFNDIALLRLKKKVKFNNYKRPICMQANRNFKDDKAKVAGYGSTEKGEKMSKLLLQVEIPLSDYVKCSDAYKSKEINFGTQICAGELKGKKDTCKGDSGGPLQIALDNPRCMYSLVGITSYGKCGEKPGVYTRVSNYIEWIESIVWPDFVIPTKLKIQA